MADDNRPPGHGAGTTDLKAAIRRARLGEAERSDVIVDLRAAEVARLELLIEELQPVLDQLPPGSDLIDCQIVPGHRPRLWVDMLGYVQMARDKHGYELVSETREGNQTLFHSDEVTAMAGKVTDYIAHRLIERDRLAARTSAPFIPEMAQQAEPLEAMRPAPESVPGPEQDHGKASAETAYAPVRATMVSDDASFWRLAFAFMLGVVAGMVALLVFGLIVTG